MKKRLDTERIRRRLNFIEAMLERKLEVNYKDRIKI